jgi:hypothetical protein
MVLTRATQDFFERVVRFEIAWGVLWLHKEEVELNYIMFVLCFKNI